MADVLKTSFDSAVSMSGDKVKIDMNKAADFAARLGKISAEILNATEQIKGPAADAQRVWTGKAAEKFFADVSALTEETAAIGVRVEQNSRQVRKASEILMNADKRASTDVSGLSTGDTFTNP